MKKFAKLFDLANGGQLLAVIGEDDDENDTLTITTEVEEGMRVNATITGEGDSATIQAAFDKFDQPQAERQWAGFHRQLIAAREVE